MKHPTFPRIFEPLQVGHLHLPNRIIMGSMHTGLEESEGGMDALAQFYAERAAGGVALIVTGGISPNREGMLGPGGARMQSKRHARAHRAITSAVHDNGGRIFMQILHGGRYSYHPFNVAPSAIKAPINRFKPRALSDWGVKRSIRAFVRSASLAKEAGYDGVEIMGSEGYLINEFLVQATNKRTDEWGGDYNRRMRFPIEIIRQIRQAVGKDFAIMYRLSMLDLVAEGSDWSEVVQLAQAVEKAGANIINTGIGWHEARIPTIATLVPRGGFAFVTKKLMGQVGIPLVTTNRFNDPVQCEEALEMNAADMVSMARPFLADPRLVAKSRDGEMDRINTCIGCNQACLDHIFKRKVASCLVNPRASHEAKWPLNARAMNALDVAVVGSGPAGLSCALEAARLGHRVSLFEASSSIGGQFNLAKRIPGKEEFHETLRYFETMLPSLGVQVFLDTLVEADFLQNKFDTVVLATGVRPRKWNVDGADQHPHVVSYLDVIKGDVPIGKRVAIIGAGGIGFDVADLLTHDGDQGFHASWGIDQELEQRGGLVQPLDRKSSRDVHLFQRSSGKVGGGLGKTTGWIHRKALKERGVTMHSGVAYQKLDESGLHFEESNESHFMNFDTFVVCAGQVSRSDLLEPLRAREVKVHVIGGAMNAKGLDAERAIKEGLEMAYGLSPWKAD